MGLSSFFYIQLYGILVSAISALKRPPEWNLLCPLKYAGGRYPHGAFEEKSFLNKERVLGDSPKTPA